MRHLRSFIQAHWDGRSPLLLGYSGGPDSKALLYALLESYASILHVAHVDHGWRSESAQEAEAIRKEIESLQLPFYTVRLNPPKRGNREAIAREERIAFFLKLKQKIPFQACLLAHHGGDLAETTLKRVLEGAHLPFLGGMEEVSSFEELSFWRPFLSISRSEILAFLREKKLEPLMDPSNQDPAYLRARMRSEIFPFLQEKFGKIVEGNLNLLSIRSSELKKYLDKKIQQVPIEKGPWGQWISFLGLERLEARYLLQKLHLALPRELLEDILDALFAKKPNCRFSETLFVDRGLLFILSASPPQFTEMLPISLGKYTHGDWLIEVTESKGPIPPPDWKTVWKGSFVVGLPRGSLALPPPGVHFKKLWNTKKIPSFLRFQVPLFFEEGKPVKEFLSGDKGEEKELVFQVVFSVINSISKE